MRLRTCNESVFSLPLCSSDERSTSLYISTASTNSSARRQKKRRPLATLNVSVTCAFNEIYTYRLTANMLQQNISVQKKVSGDHGLCFCLNWFPWETGSRGSASTKVGIYTSDDVNSSQTIECAHQLSVSFFTLHSTFLLQGLQELLHRHGAVEGTHR